MFSYFSGPGYFFLAFQGHFSQKGKPPPPPTVNTHTHTEYHMVRPLSSCSDRFL